MIRPDLAGEPRFRARFAREVAAARTVCGLFTAPVADADVPDANPDLIARLERLHWPPPAPEVRERVLARVLDAAEDQVGAGSRPEQPK